MTCKSLTRHAAGAAAALLVAAVAALAHGDTIQLRNGETIVGTARLVGTDSVLVDRLFPEGATLSLTFDDIAPESMHAILEHASDLADVAKRRELGEFAEANGLLALAVADFTAVKRLDANSSKDMDARIVRLQEQIAGEMLADAQDLLDGGNANAALLYLHTLREKFPRTDAAKKADQLAAAAHKAVGPAAEVAAKTVAAAEAPRVATQVEGHLAKGDEARKRGGGHVGSDVKVDQRSAERAIRHYEAAWGAAKTLPVAPSGDAELDARVQRLRASAKAKLVDAYLTAGTILLERRAIPGAEKYCNSACALDPENKDNHRLHALILQAKVLSYRSDGAK